MLWKQIQSNVLFIGRKVPLKSSMRVFLLSAFFSVGLLVFPCSLYAENDISSSVLTVDDLSPQQFNALAGISTVVLGDRASGSNITNDVATILSLLQSVVRLSGSGVVASSPYNSAAGTVSIGRTLYNLLQEGDSLDLSVPPSSSRSYLQEIQRALYGRAGSPVESGALLPMVAALLANSTNSANHVDMSWTNALPSLVSASTNLNAFFDGAMTAVESFVDLFGYDTANFFHQDPAGALWSIDDNLTSAISDYLSYWDSAYDSDDDSWRVQLTYDGGLGDRIGELAGTISDSNEDTVDALDGIRDLLRMISTNVAATHDDIYGASQEESNISDIATDGADDYDYAVDNASDDLSDTMDFNEPDYEVHYTDNPMAPLANAIDFTQTMRSKMPDMSQVETSSRVYLFKTEWDREHLLTRPGGSSRSGSGLGQGLSEISFDLSGSDPHVPNELLSYASTAMAWAWNLAAAVTAFYLFRQFWDWVASWRV